MRKGTATWRERTSLQATSEMSSGVERYLNCSRHQGNPINNRIKSDQRNKIVQYIKIPIYTGIGPTLAM